MSIETLFLDYIWIKNTKEDQRTKKGIQEKKKKFKMESFLLLFNILRYFSICAQKKLKENRKRETKKHIEINLFNMYRKTNWLKSSKFNF